jgi:uncharacterized protein YkwD
VNNRLRPLALALVATLVLAPAAGAARLRPHKLPPPGLESLMLAQINAARREAGLRSVRPSHVLTRDAAAWARTLVSHDYFAHALSFQRGTGFRSVGEILSLCPGGQADIAATMRAWLESPEHRPILLGGGYRWVGVAFARGPIGGRTSGVWVVRFGSR